MSDNLPVANGFLKRSFAQAFPKIKAEPDVSLPRNEIAVESPDASFVINFLDEDQDQEDNTSCTDSESSEEHSYTVLAFERQFKGQSSGRNVARWTVSAASPDEFIAVIWQLSKPFLKREIIFRTHPNGSCSYPVWGSLPEQADFGRFALFQSNRRHYTIDNVLKRKEILRCWRAKEISLYLHVYSTSIASKSVWMTVRPVLIGPIERPTSGNEGFSADRDELLGNTGTGRDGSYKEEVRVLRLSFQRIRANLEGALASFEEIDRRIGRLEELSLVEKAET